MLVTGVVCGRIYINREDLTSVSSSYRKQDLIAGTTVYTYAWFYVGTNWCMISAVFDVTGTI